MKIIAISVCVDYDDFLAETAKANKGIFDEHIIVTDMKDIEVTKICKNLGLTCIKTDVFYENGATFNKYAGINEAIKYIGDPDAWILFLDSDIVLQKETRRVLENIKLDKTCMYGIDRVNCTGWEMWEKFKSGNGLSYHNWILTTQNLEFGARLVHYYGQQGDNGRFGGWSPLGYFQFVHRSAFQFYPQESKRADHCDLVFVKQFPREKRIMIPELFGIHLETKCSQMSGVNWNGRKSPRFEPANLDAEWVHPSRWRRILISLGLSKKAA